MLKNRRAERSEKWVNSEGSIKKVNNRNNSWLQHLASSMTGERENRSGLVCWNRSGTIANPTSRLSGRWTTRWEVERHTRWLFQIRIRAIVFKVAPISRSHFLTTRFQKTIDPIETASSVWSRNKWICMIASRTKTFESNLLPSSMKALTSSETLISPCSGNHRTHSIAREVISATT